MRKAHLGVLVTETSPPASGIVLGSKTTLPGVDTEEKPRMTYAPCERKVAVGTTEEHVAGCKDCQRIRMEHVSSGE